MRGRTNITQGSGNVLVNGDIKEYVVETGNTINVGDFVSVNVGPATSYSLEGGRCFKISENKFVCFYNENLDIFNIDNGIYLEKTIVGNWRSASYIDALFQKSENEFITIDDAEYIGSESTKCKVQFLKFDFDNGTYELEEKKYFGTGFKMYGISDILLLSNNIFILSKYGLSGSGTGSNACLAWINLNDDTVKSTVTPLYVYSSKDFNVNKFFVKISDNKFFIIGNYDKNSIVKYDISSGEFEVESFNTDKDYYGLYARYLGDNKILAPHSKGVDVLEITNTVNILNTFVINSFSNNFIYQGNLYLFKPQNSYEGDYQLISGYYVIPISSIESTSLPEVMSFNLLDCYIKPHDKLLENIDFGNDFIFKGCYDYSKMKYKAVKCKLLNDIIVGYDSKIFVSEYSGKSMGFAKTGGTSGETIKVYVPHENN